MKRVILFILSYVQYYLLGLIIAYGLKYFAKYEILTIWDFALIFALFSLVIELIVYLIKVTKRKVT